MQLTLPLCFLALSALACGSDATSMSPSADGAQSASNGSAADSSKPASAGRSATKPPSQTSTGNAATAGSEASTAANNNSGQSAVTGAAAGGGGTASGTSSPVAVSGSSGTSARAAAGSGSAGSSGSAGATAGSAGMGLAAGSGGDAAGAGGSIGAAASPPKQTATRCIDPSKAKPDSEVSFPCDGVDLWVYLPKQCVTKSCGLIFNIHGGGMTDHATMDQATNMIMLGSQADYVVVHPHKGTWDVANDKGPVFEFMQQSIQAFGVDPKRVHSSGYSQGGQLSWALACEHADVVASIAPAEEVNRVTDCWTTSKLPAREIPILFAYGHRDAIGGGYDAAKTFADSIAKAWQMQGPETLVGSESAKYFRQRWTSPAGNVFEFISHDYTSTGVGGILDGHCLPMASGTTFVSCAIPVDYDWGKEVVTFFQAHPMQ